MTTEVTASLAQRVHQRATLLAAACDLFALGISLVVAAAPAFARRSFHAHDFVWLFAACAILWMFEAALLKQYDLDRAHRAALEEAGAVALEVAGVLMLIFALRRALPGVAALPHTTILALVLWPLALGARLHLALPLLRHDDPIVLVGEGPLAAATFADGWRRARSARDLEAQLRSTPVSEVYIAGDAQAAVRVCEERGIPFALPAWNVRLDRGRPAARHGLADGYVHFVCVDPRAGVRVSLKHLFDLAAAALALAVLGPFLLLMAAIIRIDSRGSAIFRQPRVGQNGRVFAMLKFRSMVNGAEKLRATLDARNECSGPVFKMVRDPRVTAVGRFIRKYSIDELPQIVNVLRGEMSLVGPRPPLASEVAQYEPWQLRRLSVRPGLTCIWQVSGRNQVEFRDWMLLDLRYIDTWTVHGDLALIAKTIPAVVSGRGAS